MKYAKPALSFAQQVQLLASRGLQIDDQHRAEHYLAHINYYRLAGYCLPFEADHATHQFRPGVRFEDVVGLYIFDQGATPGHPSNLGAEGDSHQKREVTSEVDPRWSSQGWAVGEWRGWLQVNGDFDRCPQVRLSSGKW